MLSIKPATTFESPGNPLKLIPILAALGLLLFITLNFFPANPPITSVAANKVTASFINQP